MDQAPTTNFKGLQGVKCAGYGPCNGTNRGASVVVLDPSLERDGLKAMMQRAAGGRRLSEACAVAVIAARG